MSSDIFIRVVVWGLVRCFFKSSLVMKLIYRFFYGCFGFLFFLVNWFRNIGEMFYR